MPLGGPSRRQRRRLEFEVHERAFRRRHESTSPPTPRAWNFTLAAVSQPSRHRSSRATYHSSVGPKLVAGRANLRSDKTAKVGPVGAHPLSRETTRTLAGSVLD